MMNTESTIERIFRRKDKKKKQINNSSKTSKLIKGASNTEKQLSHIPIKNNEKKSTASSQPKTSTKIIKKEDLPEKTDLEKDFSNTNLNLDGGTF